MTSDFLQTQMDYIYFFYGMGFILLAAVAGGVRRAEKSSFPWHWLSLFGLCHGIGIWLDLLTFSLKDGPALSAARLMLLALSLLFLVEFARAGTRAVTGSGPGRWIWIPPILLAASGAAAGMPGMNAACRYALGIPGGLWTAAVLWRRQGSGRSERRPLRITAAALGLYGLAAGGVVPAAGFFPADRFNQAFFLAAAGFPIQFVRGILACTAAAGLWRHYCLVRRRAFGPMTSSAAFGYEGATLSAILAALMAGWILTSALGDLGRHRDMDHYTFDLKLARTLFEDDVQIADRLVQSLAASPRLRDLAFPDRLDPADINATLDRYARIMQDTVCYVLNEKGVTLASSNRDTPASFVGHDYGVRPYYRAAMKGMPGRCVAVGMTSKLPGYYTGFPVRGPGGKIVGVAVIKINIDQLGMAYFHDKYGFLTDPHGVVLAATRPDFFLSPLRPIDPETRQRLIQSAQFPEISPTPVLPAKTTSGALFPFREEVMQCFEEKTSVADLSFVVLGPLTSWKTMRLIGILVTLLAAVLLIVFFMSRQRNRESLDRIAASEMRYRSLIEGSPNWIGLFDGNGCCISVNRNGLEKTGRTRSDFQGEHFSQLWAEPSRPAAQEAARKVMLGKRVSFEAVQIHPDGTALHFQVFLNPDFERDGSVGSFVCIANDISAYKNAEAALRKSEAAVRRKLTAITEPESDLGALDLPDILDAEAIQSLMTDFYRLTGIGFAILDLSGKPLVLVGWQDICMEFHRRNAESLNNCMTSDLVDLAATPSGTFVPYRCKNNLQDMVTPLIVGGRHLGNIHFGQFFYEDDPPEPEMFRKQARRFGFDETAYLEALDRVPRWSREKVETTMAFYAKLAGMISTLSFSQIRLSRALAERERAKEALLHLNDTLEQRVAREVARNMEHERLMIRQSRLAAMGEMIGNIAHQWRQPLNALGLLLFNIQDAFRFGSLDAAFLDQTLKDGNRLIQKMSTTISDFSDFFRPDKEKTAFSALEQIRQATALVSASFAHGRIAVQIDAAPDLMLFGFPNEYSQVLLNLLSNARDAIQDADGPVPGRVEIRLVRQDDQGCLSVRDNGGGIPADILDRMFDPYFSTKQKGSGIGLYMSKMIIERNMNGRITARNIDGGAEVTVCVPLFSKSLFCELISVEQHLKIN